MTIDTQSIQSLLSTYYYSIISFFTHLSNTYYKIQYNWQIRKHFYHSLSWQDYKTILRIYPSFISATIGLFNPLPLSSSISSAGLSTNLLSGPYNTNFTTFPSLPSHTIYYPTNYINFNDTVTQSDSQLPVMIWSNGACAGQGTLSHVFLSNIASYGVLVIANGPPMSKDRWIPPFTKDSVAQLQESLDWLHSPIAKTSYPNLNLSKITASGWSCGGKQAILSAHDPRIANLIIFNFGFHDVAKSDTIKAVKKPIAFFLGGKFDSCHVAGLRDYDNIVEGVPALNCIKEDGHLASWLSPTNTVWGKVGGEVLQFMHGNNTLFNKEKFVEPFNELDKEEWSCTSKNWPPA